MVKQASHKCLSIGSIPIRAKLGEVGRCVESGTKSRVKALKLLKVNSWLLVRIQISPDFFNKRMNNDSYS